MTQRTVLELLHGRPSADGAGVKLLRVFGGARPERFDPFLMLDEFGSDTASDYIGGFPPHPHRGFETITYMLNGKMEHRDHMGNIGLLNDGDVQWMTAGRGVIHSEMPQQTAGKMRGFQLWLNLPAARKMQPAQYRDLPGAELPRWHGAGAAAIAIAGHARLNGEPVAGFFQRPDTEPLYLDLQLQAGGQLEVAFPEQLRALLYVYEGALTLADQRVPAQHLALLSDGEQVLLRAESPARALLIAGRPLGEPIAQYGPFVMNSSEEIDQALRDYRDGKLTA